MIKIVLVILEGRKIEFDFKCDENISPEKTKPKFLREKHDTNVTYFEVATSTVCLPRMMSCEVNIFIFLYPLLIIIK